MTENTVHEVNPVTLWHRLPYSDWNHYWRSRLTILQQDSQWRALEGVRCAHTDTTNPEQGFLYWLPRYWWVLDPDATPHLTVPRPLQLAYMDNRTGDDVICKYRRGGASTIIDALMVWRCLFQPHQSGLILAHTADSTGFLWRAVRFGFDRLPDWMRPPTEKSSTRELVMAHNGSRLAVHTAGGKGVGRAGQISHLHLSEVAHYGDPDGLLSSVLETVNPTTGWLDMESTPFGDNRFRLEYDRAKGSDHREAHFFPWYDDPRHTGTPVPTESWSPTEQALGLTPAQIGWRRQTIERLGDESTFRREYPEDDVTCFLASGHRKFDTEALVNLRSVVERVVTPLQAPAPGDPWPGGDNGQWTVWVPPQEGRTYTIGADVSEGLPDGDYSHFGVLDDVTCEQVAEWHGKCDPNELGHKLNLAGLWYNEAQVAVERNNHGHATLGTLQREYGYGMLYHHSDFDGSGDGRAGFPTNMKTRVQLLNLLRQSFREGTMRVRSARFLSEAISFQDGDERETASLKRKGVYRDSVFGWGIALYAWSVGTPRIG